MPLKKARGKSEKAMQKAIANNMTVLYNDDTDRSRQQIQYIAINAANGNIKINKDGKKKNSKAKGS